MNDQKPEPPFRINRQLFLLAAVVMAMWVFVTFFYRNPYQQAVSFDYYDKHPYDEATLWTYLLVVLPLLGFGALMMWINKRAR
jgi:hypothetical protein